MIEQKKQSRMKYYLISVAAVTVFLLAWYLATDVFGLFRYNMLPSPLKVAKSFVNKLTSTVPDGNTLLTHIRSSLFVVMVGYLIGVCAGIPTGILMAWYKPIDNMVRPVFDFLRVIPGVAWIPVFTVWLGIGIEA